MLTLFSEARQKRAPQAAPLWLIAGALVFALAFLSACDGGSDDDDNLSALDGTYAAERIFFDVNGSSDFDVDLIDVGLEASPTLEILASERQFTLAYNPSNDNNPSRLFVRGSVSRSGNRLRFDVTSGAPGRLLLPSREGTDFTLQIQNGGDVLAGDVEYEGRDNTVDLTPFGVNQASLNGTLQLRFER